jgi:RNA polymerase sigma-70 factor, ECF subfamily
MADHQPVRLRSALPHGNPKLRFERGLRLVDDRPEEAANLPERHTTHALMKLVRDGDRGALQALVERFWEPLLGYVASVTNSPDDAEDVVQETFIRVWRQRSRWNPSGAVNAYLYRIARNVALNGHRGQTSQRVREERAGAELVRSASPRTPEQEFEMTSLRGEVESAVAGLSKRRREVFLLARFHGLTHQEIAEMLGLTVQTVSNHLSAALSELRQSLAHHLRRS